MRGVILTTLTLVLLAGCNQTDERIRFDGEVFRGKAAKNKDDPRMFSAQVSPVSATLEGAREAARYEGIKYCIAAYGTSQIEWTNGPDDEDAELMIDGETLTVSGTCRP